MQCRLSDHEPGRCFAGSCAYPSSDCASGYRYGPSAKRLSGTCVADDAQASTSTSATTTDDPVDDTAQECAEPCTTPPGACYASVGECDPPSGQCIYAPESEGTPCGGDEDPCFGVGVCDGQGSCSGEPVICDAPTGPCFEVDGTCDPATGVCTYAPRTAGSPCSDGGECICDGEGACVPGPTCSSDNPCEAVTCDGAGCVYALLADGSSCGPRAADRCCDGTCVDISTDDAHCGGCFTACDASQSCESIAATTMCPTNPSDTSGRCTCSATEECPTGQSCRWLLPHPDRCEPENANACAGELFQPNQCPSYCGY
jgi:hypothetical protein